MDISAVKQANDALIATIGDALRIAGLALDAMEHRVNLLGTGPIDLGTPIDWHRDPVSGRRAPRVAD